ncbi:MAG: IPT/TIG domain-containing protein [bacterium]
MVNRIITIGACAIAIALMVGCNSKGANPSSPALLELKTESGMASNPALGNSHVLWGLWEITADGVSGTIDATPLRGAMFNANVTKFLQPPAVPVHYLTIHPNPGNNILTGHIDIDVTLQHPFSGLKKWRGFDVRGIVLGEGTVPFSFDNSAIHGGPNDLMLENADGWTRWWNPTEFTTYGTILGYFKGAKAPGSYLATATVNPYKYFADGLDADAPLSDLNLDERGSFSTLPGINSRRYVIQFPIGPSGMPVYKFNYAIDASWALPDDSYAPEYPVEAFPPQANMQEAWRVEIDSSESTLWYVGSSAYGGDLKLKIEIFDWQGAFQLSGVPGEVAAIMLDSPFLPGPVDLMPLGMVVPGGPVSSVWNAEINDLQPTSSGDFDFWIGVVATYPENYAPQIQGDPSIFGWPDKPLTAFMRGSVNVSNEYPTNAPIIDAIIPNQGEVSTVVTDLQILGQNFQDGATVEFDYDAVTSLIVSNVQWVNENLVTCDVDCAGPLGLYDVTLTNPDLQFDTLDDGFEVIDSFQCSGSAHDWESEYPLTIPGQGETPNFFDMAIMTKGSHAGMALYQRDYTSWGLLDPNGGAGQVVDIFLTSPESIYCVDIETDEYTGRIAIVNLFTDESILLFDSEGVYLGKFIPDDLGGGNFTAIDFDENGDLWAATRSGDISDQTTWVWELRHYSLLDNDPFYEPVPDDTVVLNDVAMINPTYSDGIGDLGISFQLNRLYLIVANIGDGGSNRLTSWDLNATPPEKVGDKMNPFPPLTRHHIFSQGALSRMNVDVDHRFKDKYEPCRIYAYATIWNDGLDCYVIRLDGDLNILDEGSIFHMPWPLDWDSIPQCAIFYDAGDDADATLFGRGWAGNDFAKWTVPSDW